MSNDPTCDENDQRPEPTTFLGRGNAKIHKESPSQSSTSAKTGASTTSTRSLTSLTTSLR